MTKLKSGYAPAKQLVRLNSGDVIRISCEMLGLTQMELAKRAGMQPPHLNEIIKGRRQVGKVVAEKLAKVLEIPAAHILFASDFPHKEVNVDVTARAKSSALKRNKFLLDAIRALNAAKEQREKEKLVAMKCAIHLITMAIKSSHVKRH